MTGASVTLAQFMSLVAAVTDFADAVGGDATKQRLFAEHFVHAAGATLPGADQLDRLTLAAQYAARALRDNRPLPNPNDPVALADSELTGLMLASLPRGVLTVLVCSCGRSDALAPDERRHLHCGSCGTLHPNHDRLRYGRVAWNVGFEELPLPAPMRPSDTP